ncbi:MAG: tRNA pseudouridine(55) synthase TruB [Lachnospiraceae bacterium]
MINGIINVYKEKGFTSHDVVAKLRGILHQKKIGHTGTLDPDAEGVLPVCLGRGTKVCDLLTDKEKEYEAVLLLGLATDTQDITGEILEKNVVDVQKDQVEEAIGSFVGTYDQIPPMYSALKVNGKKLCDLARAGIEVERKPRKVQIFSIQILEISLPRVRMRVHCSKGTYIRTLCHDIGQKLGCGGCMESLLRTRVGQFCLDTAYPLAKIEELAKEDQISQIVQPIDAVFLKYPKVVAKPESEKLLYNGNRLRANMVHADVDLSQECTVRLYDKSGQFIGIYQYDRKKKDLKPVKLFME